MKSPRWQDQLPFLRGLAAAVAMVLAAGCDSPTEPAEGAQYDLVFVSSPAGGQGEDIYRMGADGSGRVNLTNLSVLQQPTFLQPVEYRSLTLAPNGRTLAFDTTREGCPGIWGMEADGTAIRKLTVGTYVETRCNHNPFWSTDGQFITFMTSREGAWSTYVANANGYNPRNVARALDATGMQQPTGWTPEGRVVLDHWVSGSSTAVTYVVNADGTNLQLLFGRGTDHEPAWSPDRTMVAFVREVDGAASVFVANADGTAPRRLTNHPGVDTFTASWFSNGVTAWSPDGRRIAYTSYVNGHDELHVVDVDGTHDVTLANDAEFSGWSPDGRLTFNSAVGGTQDIYLISADGTGRVNLTNTTDSDERRGLWVKR